MMHMRLRHLTLLADLALSSSSFLAVTNATWQEQRRKSNIPQAYPLLELRGKLQSSRLACLLHLTQTIGWTSLPLSCPRPIKFYPLSISQCKSSPHIPVKSGA